jgi:hypothetical protein
MKNRPINTCKGLLLKKVETEQRSLIKHIKAEHTRYWKQDEWSRYEKGAKQQESSNS